MRLWRAHKKKILASVSALLLVLLAVAGGAVYFLGSEDFRLLAEDYVVQAIADRTGTDVSLEAFQMDYAGQSLALVGLVLRGEEAASAPPLLSMDRVQVGLRWRALLRRRVDLTSLEIVRPRLYLEIGEGGQTNVPSPPPRSGNGDTGFEVAIGDISVIDGELAFDETRVRIEFGLSDFEGRFDYAEDTRVLSGHIEYAGAVDRADDGAIPYRLSSDFDYMAGIALVRSMEVESGQSRLSLQGRIDDVMGQRRGTLAYTGSVDLPFMNHFFRDETFEGEMAVTGSLEFSTTHFASQGRLDAERLGFDRWVGRNVSSNYAYGFPERILRAEDFEADVFGGHTRGTVSLLPLPGPSRVELDLAYNGVDALALASLYPWDSDHVLDARASGTMAGWFRGRFEDFDLSGEVAFTPSPIERVVDGIPLRVGGSTRYRGRPGSVQVERLDGQLGATRVSATGTVRADDFRLEVDVESGDLGDLAPFFADLTGTGAFEGVVSGRLRRPDVDGRLRLERYLYNGVEVDSIDGTVRFMEEAVSLEGMRVREGRSEVTVDGRYDLSTGQPDLDLQIHRLNPDAISDFVPLWVSDWTQRVSGTFSGRMQVDSLAPSATGSLVAEGLVYEGQDIGTAEADFDLAWPDRFRLENIRLRRGDASLDGRLDLEPGSGALQLEVAVSGQPLEDLRFLGVPDDLGGRIRTAQLTVEGTTTRPLIAGTATIEDLQFREQLFEEASLVLTRDAPNVTAHLRAGPVELDVVLDMATSGVPFTGTASFAGYDAARIVDVPSGMISATGTASFAASLNDFDRLEGDGEVLELAVRMEDGDSLIAPPFTFSFNADQVEISSVVFEDETTSISVDGSVSLTPEAPIRLTLLGDLDLSLLYPRYIGFDTRGNVSIRGDIEGTLDNPQLDGSVTLRDVFVGHPELFFSLSEVNGEMVFDPDRVTLIDVGGVAGGGRVALGGTIQIEGLSPGFMDLRADASDVRIRTPQGLRTVFDARLGLRGEPAMPVLEGNVDLQSLSFDENFEAFLALFRRERDAGLPTDPGPMDTLTLALHVEGDEGIRIDNELVRVEARVDLDVGGTLAQPTLTGHAESIEGVLNLQGNRYRVTRGNVDFVDPVGIDPRIDVQAETDVRDYTVILTFTGSADNLRMDMRSDPALPQLEIVSLIAGGRTREELADTTAAGAVPTSEELFQGAAATLLTDLLSERVGSRFGLGSRVRIDPFLVGAENDPVARLTISEQVTRDLTITYSQDLSSNRQEIILIEYFLDNNTSFIASRDETGAVGLDIKLRKRFR